MTNLKRLNLTPHLILIICLSIFIGSCSKKDDTSLINGISKEIKDLIYCNGDENASIVLINAQSGPDNSLNTNEVDFIVEKFNMTDILTVNVHQAQTLESDIIACDDITLEQAVNYNNESIKTLHKVITYFKGKGRTVYVLGTSFGAFITQELIANNGIDVADKYLIMIGRLDMNDIMWQGLAEGKNGYFENGITPKVDPSPSMDVLERNLGKIAAGLGMNRYTQQLNAIEDLSNLTYIYGKTDQFVGSLTAEEVEFLASKNANIIAGPGNHDETQNDFLEQGLKEAFGIE